MGLRCNECDKRPARRPSAGTSRELQPPEGRRGIRLAAAPRRPVLPLVSCPPSVVLGLFGSPVPRPRSSGRAQQFWRMYVPSMLAVRPFRLELSLLLMVLATVKPVLPPTSPLLDFLERNDSYLRVLYLPTCRFPDEPVAAFPCSLQCRAKHKVGFLGLRSFHIKKDHESMLVAIDGPTKTVYRGGIWIGRASRTRVRVSPKDKTDRKRDGNGSDKGHGRFSSHDPCKGIRPGLSCWATKDPTLGPTQIAVGIIARARHFRSTPSRSS